MTSNPFLKTLFFIIFLFFAHCNQGANPVSLSDSSTLEGLLFQWGIGSQIPFICRSNPPPNLPVGKLERIDFDCNFPIEVRDFPEKIKAAAPALSDVKVNWRSDSSFSLNFTPMEADGSLSLDLSWLQNQVGALLTEPRFRFVINNLLPTLSISRFATVTDYSFFSDSYWDVSTNEPLVGLGIPKLSGSLANQIRIRDITMINPRLYRIFFERLSTTNEPGDLRILFDIGTDTAGNLINSLFQLQFVGIETGPSLQVPRSFAFSTILSDQSVVVGYGRLIGNSQFEIWRKGESSFRTLNTSFSFNFQAQTFTKTHQDSILVTGGEGFMDNGVAKPTSEAFLYNPLTDTRENLPNLPIALAGHTAVLLEDNRILIAGGIPFWTDPFLINAVRTTFFFNPNTKTFSAGPNLLQARSFHCATRLKDGRVFFAGGSTRAFSLFTETTEIYNPTTNTFTAGPLLPFQNCFHQCQLLEDGTVLITPGRETISPNAYFIFNPMTNSIQTLPTLSVGRIGSSVTEWRDGGILSFGGGITTLPSDASRRIDKWDTQGSKSFLTLGLDPKSRSLHTWVRFSNGSLLFIGGTFPNGTASSETFFYGPKP